MGHRGALLCVVCVLVAFSTLSATTASSQEEATRQLQAVIDAAKSRYGEKGWKPDPEAWQNFMDKARELREGHAVRSHDAPEFQKGGRRPLAAAAEQEAALQGDSQALGGMHKTEL